MVRGIAAIKFEFRYLECYIPSRMTRHGQGNEDPAKQPVQTNVRLALVEDGAKFRRQMIETLNGRADWRVVAACANAADALREIPAARPDLLLLDILLSRGSGIDLIQPLRARLPALQVVMLTVVEHAPDIVRAIRAGACGYILKKDATDLVQNVEEVLAGGAPVMSPSVARQLWKQAQGNPLNATREGTGLSPREWEILQLAARGRQQGEIAKALGISVHTVRTHFRHLYEKLGVTSPLEAVIKLNAGRGLLDDNS